VSKKTTKQRHCPELIHAFDTLAGQARKSAEDAENYALENKPRSAFNAITTAVLYASAARMILGDATPDDFEQFATITFAREAELRATYEKALAYTDLLEIGERSFAALAGPADEALRYLSHLDIQQ